MMLTGKVAIVTGAARGIGRVCAERLAADGAKVVIADIADAAGNKVAKELSSKGLIVSYVHANVAERLDVHNLIAAAREAHGSIEILVTAASVFEHVPFLDLDEAAFDRTLNVNLKGTFLCVQAAARQMIRQIAEEGRQPGSIVAVSSPNPSSGWPDSVAYAASKGAIAQLTTSAAVALAEHGIRLNAVGPGAAESALADAVTPPAVAPEKPLSDSGLDRIDQSEKIAAIVAWLVSDQASGVTGQTIYADTADISAPLALTPPGQTA